ncbi:MAG: helix-turn-helix domain-containing protein [Candidatus Bathyarchaeia archaeon]
MNNVQTILVNWGFSEKESLIYIILIKNGPLKVKEIVKITGINRVQVYELLRKMRNKAIIEQSTSYPIMFKGVSPDDLSELFIKIKKFELLTLEKNKEELSAEINKIQISDRNIETKFNIVQNLDVLMSKSLEFSENARCELAIRNDHLKDSEYDWKTVFKITLTNIKKNNAYIKIITNSKNEQFVNELMTKYKNYAKFFEFRIYDSNKEAPDLTIKDNEEILISLTPIKEKPQNLAAYKGVLTNSKPFVNLSADFFNECWNKSRKIRFNCLKADESEQVKSAIHEELTCGGYGVVLK